MKRIAVLASGSGSDFQSVVDACEAGKCEGKVVLLIYDRKEAYVRERASKHGILSVYLNKRALGGEEALEVALLSSLREHNIDLVVLAGYLSQVGQSVVNAYEGRIINIHPALIPSFCGKGFYGHNVHDAVIESGVKLSGCTVHFVDAEMDTGAIILQESVPVYYEDTAEAVAARVLEVEHRLLPQAVALFCADKLVLHGRRVEILD